MDLGLDGKVALVTGGSRGIRRRNPRRRWPPRARIARAAVTSARPPSIRIHRRNPRRPYRLQLGGNAASAVGEQAVARRNSRPRAACRPAAAPYAVRQGREQAKALARTADRAQRDMLVGTLGDAARTYRPRVGQQLRWHRLSSARWRARCAGQRDRRWSKRLVRRGGDHTMRAGDRRAAARRRGRAPEGLSDRGSASALVVPRSRPAAATTRPAATAARAAGRRRRPR